ncbi:hypothetical protein [Streptomyces rishiriensis]|uniref:Uncharacterized protein n=1 Tax=Streptomyces rishiriensis TaxID=68264 RepID=A0ABU0NYJ5_STRRH|nr:hypothetical protein [Streptomyces rishiriensis]MDQ0583572.1 hypothetical protein [Streptomyces rishiriensis]
MSDRPSEEHRSGSEKGEGNGSSISDQEWAEFVRESERAIPDSAPKEPSARAREVTDRLRRQEARGATPTRWRTVADLQQTHERASRRRRRLWAFLGVPVAIALGVVAMRPSLLPGNPFRTGVPSSAAAASPLPAETAAPTAAPGAAGVALPTIERPFAGSPALQWADGAAGIVPPKATRIGSLSKAQVEQALQQTRKLLIDANLDPATLRGGRPETALSVLEPRQKEMLDLLNTSLSKPDEEHDPLLMFSRFDPAELRLAGDVVKTRGRMTFEAGESASVVVHADYTFVYPLVRVDEDAPTEVQRTIVRRVVDVELFDPDKWIVTPGKITVTRYDQEIGNSACDVYDGYLHPQFSTAAAEQPTGAPATGPTTDPYDRSQDIAHVVEEGCGVVSRT